MDYIDRWITVFSSTFSRKLGLKLNNCSRRSQCEAEGLPRPRPPAVPGAGEGWWGWGRGGDSGCTQLCSAGLRLQVQQQHLCVLPRLVGGEECERFGCLCHYRLFWNIYAGSGGVLLKRLSKMFTTVQILTAVPRLYSQQLITLRYVLIACAIDVLVSDLNIFQESAFRIVCS